MKAKTGIERAIEKMDTQEALGAALRPPVTQQAISLWVKQGYAPWERVHAVAELTGIPGRELCDPRLVELLG